MQVAMKSPNLNDFQTMDFHQRKIISPIIKGTSRGARFLDLVKNNKLNVSPQLTRRLSQHGKNMRDIMERAEKKTDDYLKFSNTTPNLNSSPSSSILSKRKSVIETPDSPSQNSAKRKRVSFNDPVSTTKEYLITEEEEKLKSNSLIRCLTYENDENEGLEQDEECSENKENIISMPVVEEKREMQITEEEEITVKIEKQEVDTNSAVMDHDYENPQNTDITTSSVEESLTQIAGDKSETQLIFKDKDDLMDYVTKNFTVNEIFDKLLQSEEDETLRRKELIDNVLNKVDVNDVLSELLPIQDRKQTKMTSEQQERTTNLINHLSKMMKINDRIKHKVLDMLAEKHSKDFLSVALQENSVSTVCQKLTIPSIVNYLVHKVNVCEDDEIDFEINRMNRTIMHHLIKKTGRSREIITDQKEVQELLKLMFQNMPKIELLDTVHEFLRSNIIQGPF